MGKRISRVYTRTGDNGATGLTGNRRMSKSHPRINAIGDVDELNSEVGVLGAWLTEHHQGQIGLRTRISRIQQDLFDVGGELSMPGVTLLDESRWAWLEAQIDQFNEFLPALENFILPGGSMGGALAHRARAVCRRAERSLVAMAPPDQGEKVQDHLNALIYLNRLSDLLFVIARYINLKLDGCGEVLWDQQTKAKG